MTRPLQFLLPALQPPHGRVRRLLREPGPLLASSCLGDPRGGRRLRRRLPLLRSTRRRPTARRRGMRADEEGHRFIAHLDDLVDYWDVHVGTMDWGEDAGPVPHPRENHQARVHGAGRQGHTDKPVVNVGRFTNPDTMAGRSGRASATSSAPPGRRSPTRSCRQDRGRAGSTRSASASAATSASRASSGRRADLVHPEPDVRRGVPPRLAPRAVRRRPPTPTTTCSSSAPARPAWSARWCSASAACAACTSSTPGRARRAPRWVPSCPGLGEWRRVVDYRQVQLDRSSRTSSSIPDTRLTAEDVARLRRRDRRRRDRLAVGGRRPERRHPGADPGADARQPHVLTPEQ